jgi:signal transduction histidine kinase
VTLDVRDDGVGGAAARPGGFGLTSMSERIAGLHGALAIESEPGSGTAVSASVPA